VEYRAEGPVCCRAADPRSDQANAQREPDRFVQVGSDPGLMAVQSREIELQHHCRFVTNEQLLV